MKKFEVELVNVDENNAITNSNCWGMTNINNVEGFITITDTLEEAREEAQRLAEMWQVNENYDVIIINELEVDEDGDIIDCEEVEETEI